MDQAQEKAAKIYREKHYDRISIEVTEEYMQAIRRHANELDESVDDFVARAIKETMSRDKDDKVG